MAYIHALHNRHHSSSSSSSLFEPKAKSSGAHTTVHHRATTSSLSNAQIPHRAFGQVIRTLSLLGHFLVFLRQSLTSVIWICFEKGDSLQRKESDEPRELGDRLRANSDAIHQPGPHSSSQKHAQRAKADRAFDLELLVRLWQVITSVTFRIER